MSISGGLNQVRHPKAIVSKVVLSPGNYERERFVNVFYARKEINNAIPGRFTTGCVIVATQ